MTLAQWVDNLREGQPNHRAVKEFDALIAGLDETLAALGANGLMRSEIPKAVAGLVNHMRVHEYVAEHGSLVGYDTHRMGYATTREILEELSTRIEVDGNLDYRTVDSD